MNTSALLRAQPGASTSAQHLPHPTPYGCRLLQRVRQNARRSDFICAASSSGGGGRSRSADFSKDAQQAAERAFKEAQKSWEQFAKDQNLEEKGRQAARKAQEAAEDAKDKARRAWLRMDSELEMSEKIAKGTRRAEEVARDLDQQYGIRRRFRSTREYVTRMWPVWQQQLDAFTATWYGKAAVFLGICLLVSTPVFWSVMNLLLLLWWLSIPASMFLINYAQRKQAEQFQQQQAAEQARRAANPFADLFGRAASGAAGAGARAGAGRGSGSSSGGRGGRWAGQQDGPIIDAEWTSIDEDGGSRRTRR